MTRLRLFVASLLACLLPALAHAQDGTQKWAFDIGDWVDSSPAIGADGTIYVGSSD